jgi:hypothetical protein
MAGCGAHGPPPKEYQLTGQIISMNAENEVLVKHETFRVHAGDDDAVQGEGRGAAQRQAGRGSDHRHARGRRTEASLTAITKTGSAPVDDPPLARRSPHPIS